jgi:hypothetical protein
VLVCVAVIGVPVWQLLDTLEQEATRLQEQSAKLTLNQLRAALVIKGAEVKLRHGGDYPAWRGKNPFDWLEGSPAGYTGLCPDGNAEPGQWCFQPSEAVESGHGRIMFRPAQPINIAGQQGNRETPLAWTVGLEFTDSNGNGKRDADERASGLTLVPVAAE